MIINEQNYVDRADAVIKKLNETTNQRMGITTTKIRNLLAITADIYNEIVNCGSDQLSEEVKGRIEYLRVRFTYEAGREPRVKELIEEAEILEILRQIQGSKKNYILFNHYMEALVAFHRFYGGKDA